MYIIYDDFYLKHFTGPSHVENAGRLAWIIAAIKKSTLSDELNFCKPQIADPARVCLVHDQAYVKKIAALSEECAKLGNNMMINIDIDTVVSKYTYESAMLAAGAGVSGIDMIFGGEKDNIYFALVRPPGHHAFKDKGSGFCIFNNIAIAAAYSIESQALKRIAIIDFDVHHGNGTQDIFYEDGRVLYISLHQYPHYPGTGNWLETGRGKGEGFNLNIPLAANSSEIDYIYAVSEIILPVLERFKPELLLFSAGYDAHKDDPLSSVNLEDGSYKKIMELILNCCRHFPGKHISNIAPGSDEADKPKGFKAGLILEGGYDYKATAKSVLRTINACLETEKPGFSFKDPENIDEVIKKDSIKYNNINACNLKNFENIKKLFGI